MEVDDTNQADQLEELMRSLTLAQDLEALHLHEDWHGQAEPGGGLSTAEGRVDMDMEYELLEHALLDFTMMDLDLELHTMEDNEELYVHVELDTLLEELKYCKD